MLERARQYEKENAHKADAYRPHFHVTGGIGWINDPNGFSVYKGEYHLFHQYHPYSTEWGPMHWGHLKSSDLIKWERLPVALAPDSAFDRDGCYSGTAIETPDNKHLLIYTGVVKEYDNKGRVSSEVQHQCVAIGDGREYVKYMQNPVIGVESLPEGNSHSDFRDPKIWREGNSYYVLVANRAVDGSGVLLLYTSEDGVCWSFVKIFAECKNRYGSMWECPDFFCLEDKGVLIVSPMEMEADPAMEFHPGQGVVAMCGSYDREQLDFKEEWTQAVDYGTDFYAPETLETPDGRRILIGWMRNWATTCMRPDNTPIFGAMTIPRELFIKDGRLFSKPVEELKKYRSNSVFLSRQRVQAPISFAGINGRCIDLTVSVEAGEYSFFRVRLAEGSGHYAAITYRPCENTVTIDRTCASKRMDTVQNRTFPVNNLNGKITFRIIVDCDSVELFVNDGERAATFLVYNETDAQGISFEADREVYVSMEKYEISLNNM